MPTSVNIWANAMGRNQYESSVCFSAGGASGMSSWGPQSSGNVKRCPCFFCCLRVLPSMDRNRSMTSLLATRSVGTLAGCGSIWHWQLRVGTIHQIAPNLLKAPQNNPPAIMELQLGQQSRWALASAGRLRHPWSLPTYPGLLSHCAHGYTWMQVASNGCTKQNRWKCVLLCDA